MPFPTVEAGERYRRGTRRVLVGVLLWGMLVAAIWIIWDRLGQAWARIALAVLLLGGGVLFLGWLLCFILTMIWGGVLTISRRGHRSCPWCGPSSPPLRRWCFNCGGRLRST
jgi:hypothetical protein